MRKTTILLPLLFLAGCVHPEIARPPADKLVCPDEPARPAGQGETYTDPQGVERRRVTDEEAGNYMKALRASWQGCKDDVDWLRDWFKALP